MSTNETMRGGETVSAVLTRATDGKKTVIAKKGGLKGLIKRIVQRVEPLFTRF